MSNRKVDDALNWVEGLFALSHQQLILHCIRMHRSDLKHTQLYEESERKFNHLSAHYNETKERLDRISHKYDELVNSYTRKEM